ncbi:hypothetical protein BGZ70_007213 [Mortierella alpina]|uniref:Alcohol dehydrogenase n=1 Tax=Mortierella alpina TaxID=64518 RepID=A0A9P6J741_MORAP|nr:hypothetical protein BGZ70_007213 [Mortierella alpina]
MIRAAVLEKIKPTAPFLNLTRVPAPVAGKGDVVVKVLASRVTSGSKACFDGTEPLPVELPMIPGPGAIGTVKSHGPGATHLKVGQMVYVDPTIRARDHPINPQGILQGVFMPPGLDGLLEWRHGSLAEELLIPAENVTVIPTSVQQKYTSEQLTSLAVLTIPHGGMVSAGLKQGQTIAITGSTGSYGSAAVAVALAMGARRVLAGGRNKGRLDEFVKVFGSRVVPVVQTGDEAKDTEAFIQAAGEGFDIDVAFDILPPAADFGYARSAILALRPQGVAVLMGGVSTNVVLPYSLFVFKDITIKGKYMHDRADPTQLLGMIDAGLLDLSKDHIETFKLEQVEEAIEWAAANPFSFKAAVVVP